MPVKNEEEIENFIEEHPSVIEKDLIILGRQVYTNSQKKEDVMGLDTNGNVVIIELKQKSTNRDVIAQILEYGVWAEGLGFDSLQKISKKHNTLEKFTSFYKKLEKEQGEFPELNETQKWYVVAEHIDSSTKKIAEYLQGKDIEINCIELSFRGKKGKKFVHTNIVVGKTSTNSSISDKEQVDWEYYQKIGWKQNEIKCIKSITDDFVDFGKKKNWEGNIVLNERYVALQENNRRRNLLSLRVRNRKIRFDVRTKEDIKELEPTLDWKWYNPKKLWRVNLGINEIPKIEIFEKIFEKIREN